MDKESIKDQLARAMADMERTQQAVAQAKAQLRTASVTVRSRDRAVEATVGAQGQLADVKFLDGRYRTMGAAQLTASVLEAVTQAQAQMAQTVMDTFRPLSDSVTGAPRLDGVGIEWDEIFAPLADTASKGRAAHARSSDRLRDEIHEDGDRR
ncbi:YbaB/EbfC family nucleoid-associated protein [Streptomyces sp. NPDC059679]|uniref:YbaB/EbfC family nucleoid-associated protein n=1 Tax=Streptomyces sp. NPDC059679 TaxID=3346903 RepID=UPI0036C746EC